MRSARDVRAEVSTPGNARCLAHGAAPATASCHRTVLSLRVLACAVVAMTLTATGVVAYQQMHAARSALAETLPGPVDVGFAQFMGLHHQQAIGMSQLLLDGRPTRLAGLARSIAGAQLLELGEMQGWLRLWGKPLLPATRNMSWMLSGDAPPDPQLSRYLLDCQRSATGMVGLASDAELNRLRELEGRARDEHFLKLMLAHHEGGVPMARLAAQRAQLPAVRDLATRIILDQSREIAQIQLMLAALPTAAD